LGTEHQKLKKYPKLRELALQLPPTHPVHQYIGDNREAFFSSPNIFCPSMVYLGSKRSWVSSRRLMQPIATRTEERSNGALSAPK
jgi:hypothetical protein